MTKHPNVNLGCVTAIINEDSPGRWSSPQARMWCLRSWSSVGLVQRSCIRTLKSASTSPRLRLRRHSVSTCPFRMRFFSLKRGCLPQSWP